MNKPIAIDFEDTHSDYSDYHKDVQSQIHHNVNAEAQASSDWRTDAQTCYRELLDSKTQAECRLIHVECFMCSMNGTQAQFIAKVRRQFFELRIGK